MSGNIFTERHGKNVRDDRQELAIAEAVARLIVSRYQRIRSTRIEWTMQVPSPAFDAAVWIELDGGAIRMVHISVHADSGPGEDSTVTWGTDENGDVIDFPTGRGSTRAAIDWLTA
ncbi:MAG: hypothetical protein ACTHXC_00345 [Brachybacterium sp.]